jgi:hypothetical protein
MNRNAFIIPLMIIVLVAFQIGPVAHAEPFTLTVMAIAGLVTVLTAGSVDMATSDHDSTQTIAENNQTDDTQSKSVAYTTETRSEDSAAVR